MSCPNAGIPIHPTTPIYSPFLHAKASMSIEQMCLVPSWPKAWHPPPPIFCPRQLPQNVLSPSLFSNLCLHMQLSLLENPSFVRIPTGNPKFPWTNPIALHPMPNNILRKLAWPLLPTPRMNVTFPNSSLFHRVLVSLIQSSSLSTSYYNYCFQYSLKNISKSIQVLRLIDILQNFYLDPSTHTSIRCYPSCLELVR